MQPTAGYQGSDFSIVAWGESGMPVSERRFVLILTDPENPIGEWFTSDGGETFFKITKRAKTISDANERMAFANQYDHGLAAIYKWARV